MKAKAGATAVPYPGHLDVHRTNAGVYLALRQGAIPDHRVAALGIFVGQHTVLKTSRLLPQSLGVRFPEACFACFGGVRVRLMSEYQHKSHNVSVLMYHLVCPAKYRRVVFDEEVDAVLKEVCLDIAQRYEIVFLEIGTDKDHVHFLVQSVPT